MTGVFFLNNEGVKKGLKDVLILGRRLSRPTLNHPKCCTPRLRIDIFFGIKKVTYKEIIFFFCSRFIRKVKSGDDC